MKSLDTNVVIRLLAQDDKQQYASAAALLAEPCFIPQTVLVEAEWVLRATYQLPRATVAQMLETLLEGPSVTVENAHLVEWAIKRYRAGADFADMIHLVASPQESTFATFDRAIKQKAGKNAPVLIDILA